MPKSVTCQQCQQTVYLPDNFNGNQAYCPYCGDRFTIPPRAGAAENSDPWAPRAATAGGGESRGFEEPGRSPGEVNGTETAGWWSAHAGLRLQGISHLLYLGGLCVGGLVLLLAVAQTMSTSPRGYGDRSLEQISAILGVIVGLLWLSGWIISVIAGCFLALAPNRRNARALAIAILLLSTYLLMQGLNTMTYAVGSFFTYRDPYYGPPTAALLAIPVLEIVRLTLLACLLRAFVVGLRLRGPQGTSVALIVLTPSLLFCVTALTILLSIFERPSPTVWAVISLIALGGLVTILAMGLFLMWQIRRAIVSRLREFPD